MPAPKHSKAAISNAIAAAQAAGLTPTGIRFGADGSLTIDISRHTSENAANDAPIGVRRKPRKWGQEKYAA